MSDVPLPSEPNTQITIYADETTVYTTSKSSALLCKHLQDYLDALADWCHNWGISTNGMKRKAFLITKKRAPLLTPLAFEG
jgi:hypothetical protein